MQKFHKGLEGKYQIKKVFHNRNKKGYNAETLVIIQVGAYKFSGLSRCSLKDQFRRKLGFRIALGRALKNANSGLIDNFLFNLNNNEIS